MIFFWNKNNWGITGRSLMSLRNELSKRLDHDICVLEVPTGNEICGFLIIDNTTDECVFTGDGFRTDKRGEGGRGYDQSKVLLALFGIKMPIGQIYPKTLKSVGAINFYDNQASFVCEIKEAISEHISNYAFSTPLGSNIYF